MDIPAMPAWGVNCSVGCWECPQGDPDHCTTCKFSFLLGSDGMCFLPLALCIHCFVKALIVVLGALLVGGIIFKQALLNVYQKQHRGSININIPKGLEDEAAAELEALRGCPVELSDEAIWHGISSMSYSRNMDWGDADAKIDAAYEPFSDRGDQPKMEGADRLVPREWPVLFDMHTKFIMGVGVPLFLNYHALPLVLTLLLLATTSWATATSGLAELHDYSLRRSDPTPTTGSRTNEILLRYAEAMWLGLGVTHAVVLCFSLLHAACQWRFAHIFNKYNSTVRDYTLELDRLPTELTSEQQLKDHCEAHFGVELVGVSIWIDSQKPGLEGEGTVGDMMSGMLERLVIDYDINFDQTKEPDLRFEFGYDRSLQLPDDADDFAKDKERFRALLESGKLRGSGQAAVVFKSKQEVREAFSKGGPVIDGKKAEVREASFEPTGLEWLNIGTTREERRVRRYRAILTMSGVFMLACGLVYGPITFNISLPLNLEHAEPDVLTSQGIGIINGIVGAILGSVLFQVAGSIGYHLKSDFDKWCLVFCVISALVNFGFGNIAVLWRYLTRGLGAVDLRVVAASNVTNQTVHEQLEDEMRLSDFYFHLLMPGMILTGWVVGKVMGDICPFLQAFLMTKIVFVARCLPLPLNKLLAFAIPWNPRVVAKDGVTRVPLSAREAERIWAPKILSVAWEYPDKILNPTIVCLMLFMYYDRTWQIFLLLLLWLLVAYVHHRFVQFRTYSKYMNSLRAIELLAQRLWTLPLSVLAAAWCYWGARLGYGNWRWACPLAVCASSLIFNLGLTLIYRHFDVKDLIEGEKEDSYEKVSRRLQYSWFNANPAYVLKSHYTPEVLGARPEALRSHYAPACFGAQVLGALEPFLYGKEYLVLDHKGRP